MQATNNPSSNLSSLSDEELIRQTGAALGRAHRAPMAEWSKDHRGHSSIVNHTSAWSKEANEYARLNEEIKRRRITGPVPCDCPHGFHKALKASR